MRHIVDEKHGSVQRLIAWLSRMLETCLCYVLLEYSTTHSCAGRPSVEKLRDQPLTLS